MRDISRRKDYSEFTPVGKPFIVSRLVSFAINSPPATIKTLVLEKIKERGLEDKCDSFTVSEACRREDYRGIVLVPELNFQESDRRTYFELNKEHHSEFYAVQLYKEK